MKFSAELNLNLFEFLATEGYFSEFKGRWSPLGLFGDDIIVEIEVNAEDVVSFILPANEIFEFLGDEFFNLICDLEKVQDDYDIGFTWINKETRYLILELDNEKWQGTITQREADQIKVATEEAIKSSEYECLLPLIKGVQIQ